MKTYTAWLRDNRTPILLPDSFSLGAFLFGPIWLLVHAAWIPGLILLALGIVLPIFLHGAMLIILALAIAWLTGLHGQDLRGWTLSLRGWRLAHIVAARDHDAAYLRLLASDPALQDVTAT
jgi:hypothetical protein